MDIGTLLSDSWAIVRRHKALWLFGFLAALGSGGNGGFRFMGSADGSGPNRWSDPLNRIPSEQLGLIVGILCVVGVAAFLLVVILSTMGRAGLIKGAGQADDGAASISVGQLWSDTVPYFWSMLLFDIAIVVLIVVAVMGLVMLGIFSAITVIGLACFIPLLCLLVPAFVVASWWIELSRVALVNDGVDVFEALRRGWVLFRARFGDVLLLGIVTIVLYIVVWLLLLLPFIALMMPVALGLALANDAARSGGILIALAGFCLYLPIAILVSSILQTYFGTAWTLLYRRLSGLVPPATELLPPPPPETPYPMTTV